MNKIITFSNANIVKSISFRNFLENCHEIYTDCIKTDTNISFKFTLVVINGTYIENFDITSKVVSFMRSLIYYKGTIEFANKCDEIGNTELHDAVLNQITKIMKDGLTEISNNCLQHLT